MHQLVLIGVIAIACLSDVRAALPRSAQDAEAAASLGVYPGATLDRAESDASNARGGRVQLYRTPDDFDLVLSHYRFKRKQTLHVVEEDLGERFRRMAALMDAPEPPPALLADPFVQRFHQFALGTTTPSREKAVAAWRDYAKRLDGTKQRVAEGTRVTIVRPYLSSRTFTLINETVIVLRTSGGK